MLHQTGALYMTDAAAGQIHPAVSYCVPSSVPVHAHQVVYFAHVTAQALQAAAAAHETSLSVETVGR